MSTTTIQKAAAVSLPHSPPEEILEAIDDFFTYHPDSAETDMLLWRMFYHATLYDMDKNGVAAFFEDYGELHGNLKMLINRLRAMHLQIDTSK